MSGTRSDDHAPFAGGPAHRFQTWLGLIRSGNPHVVRRALLALLLAWLPLALLSVLRGEASGAGHENAFLFDFGAYSRFALATPFLILAESVCIPRLAAIARQFVGSRLVADDDDERYRYALDSTQRLIRAGAADVAAVLLAYALIALLYIAAAGADVPGWHGAAHDGALSLSPAGWWSLLVSLPILLVLLLGWVWRLCLWTRFLWLMSRIDLRLVAAHPDHAGGLRFVSSSLEAFAPLGLTIGIMAVGPVANRVVHHGASIAEFKSTFVGVVVFVLALFAGPLLVFVRRLVREYYRGTFRYGALAVGVGQQLERKWLTRGQPPDKSSLEVPDFSATTDLYSIVANVYAMRVLPFELRGVLLLAIVTALPFVPVALLSVPVSVILRKIASLLL